MSNSTILAYALAVGKHDAGSLPWISTARKARGAAPLVHGGPGSAVSGRPGRAAMFERQGRGLSLPPWSRIAWPSGGGAGVLLTVLTLRPAAHATDPKG